MKLIFAMLLVSFGAMAEDQVICHAQNVGKTCYVGNGQKEITGECVWLQNHYLPSCLIVDCAEKPHTTLNLNCKKSESESGNCQWNRGFAFPQCE